AVGRQSRNVVDGSRLASADANALHGERRERDDVAVPASVSNDRVRANRRATDARDELERARLAGELAAPVVDDHERAADLKLRPVVAVERHVESFRPAGERDRIERARAVGRGRWRGIGGRCRRRRRWGGLRATAEKPAGGGDRRLRSAWRWAGA